MADNELGLLKDYWYPIFMGGLLIYHTFIFYLHNTYGYELDE